LRIIKVCDQINVGKIILKPGFYLLTVVGITGTVSIDENGDRNTDYSLLDLNPVTQEFEVNFAY